MGYFHIFIRWSFQIILSNLALTVVIVGAGQWTPLPPRPTSSFLNYQTKISVNGDDGGDSIRPTLQLLYYAQTELSRGQSLSSVNQHLLRQPFITHQIILS